MTIGKLVRGLRSPKPTKDIVKSWLAKKETFEKPELPVNEIWPYYSPQSPDTLRSSVLKTDFARFTSHRHERIQVPRKIASEPFEDLSMSVYAHILASAPRMDVLSRTILPSDLLIRLAIVTTPDENLMLTPMGYKDVLPGPKCYVPLSRRALESLKGRHISLMQAMLFQRQRSEVRKLNAKKSNHLLWREDPADFYCTLMWNQIILQAQSAAVPCSESPLKIHLSDVNISAQQKASLQTALNTTESTIYLEKDALTLLVMIRRYELYNNEQK